MMIRRLFLNDRFILPLILLNAVTIFASGFDVSPAEHFFIASVDNCITILFVIEMVVKMKEYGMRYFESGWNVMDCILVILSLPALFIFFLKFDSSSINIILVFRVLRVFKTFRFFKFIPDVDVLFKGIQRALKASVVVLLGFMVYIFIIGSFSFYMFHETAPDFFGNPLVALYSTFKIFTVEGWFEVPESITSNLTPTASFFTYLYFIFVLITGGIFGLSLVNSIFVDAMVMDNNDDIEAKIDKIDAKLNELLKNNE